MVELGYMKELPLGTSNLQNASNKKIKNRPSTHPSVHKSDYLPMPSSMAARVAQTKKQTNKKDYLPMPSSIAARVAQSASLTRSFFSFISTSEAPPIFRTATPEDNLNYMRIFFINKTFFVNDQ